MADTSIEWADKVWNPVTGCTKVSQGCKHCYAEANADRFFKILYPPNADGSARKFTDVRCHDDRLEQPLHWREPSRIFVNSMSDLFHEDVHMSFIHDVFSIMAQARQHTFQILTKRPARMLEIMRNWRHCGLTLREGHGCVLPNVHLGVSVEDQKTADERIPILLQTPAAVRWVSYEPALGPINFDDVPHPIRGCHALSGIYMSGIFMRDGINHCTDRIIRWLVVGGESGLGARPMHQNWVRCVRDQCAAAGVPFFFKQWGAWTPGRFTLSGRSKELVLYADGRSCTFTREAILAEEARSGIRHNAPGMDATLVSHVGKKRAGRLLDGHEWNQYPSTTELAPLGAVESKASTGRETSCQEQS